MDKGGVPKLLNPEDFKVEYMNQETKNKVCIKRQRGENWSEVDKELLKELIKKRVKDVENKNTDTNTNQAKKKAWLDIQNDFNSLCSCNKRTIYQLRSQWSTIKMQAKKEMSDYRAKSKQTGGGLPPTEVTLSGSDISVWLPNEFVVDTNEFDSDVIFLKDDEISNDNCETVLVSSFDDGKNQFKEAELIVEEKLPQTKKKKLSPEKSSAADDSISKIATTDVECRKELHHLQIEVEKKKMRNLDLEYELIRARLNFYKKKSLDSDI